MSRRRKIIWLGSILLALACAAGGFWWHWQATAVDRKVCQLVYEAAGYPDTRTEKAFKKWKLDFLLREKPKPREGHLIQKEFYDIGPASVPGLISLLEDENEQVRYLAALTIAEFEHVIWKIKMGKGTPFYSNYGVHFSPPPPSKFLDSRALDPFIKILLHDPSEKIRQIAAQALGELADPKATEPLTQALQNDVDEYVRLSSAESLGAIHDKRAIDPLVQVMWKDESDDVRARVAESLGAIGSSGAVESLIKAVREGTNLKVRFSAAQALGEIGDPRALEEAAGGKINFGQQNVYRDAIAKIRSAIARQTLIATTAPAE